MVGALRGSGPCMGHSSEAADVKEADRSMDKRIKAVAGAFLLTVAFLVLSLSGHIAQAQRSALHSSATPAPLPLSRGNFFGKHYIDPRYGCYIAGILYQNGINFLVPFDSAKEASFINLNTRALPHPYNALVFYLGVDIGSDVQANFRIIEDGLLYRTIHVTGSPRNFLFQPHVLDLQK